MYEGWGMDSMPTRKVYPAMSENPDRGVPNEMHTIFNAGINEEGNTNPDSRVIPLASSSQL